MKTLACIGALLLVAPAAAAQEPGAQKMMTLRLEGWAEPVRLPVAEAYRIIFTAFVKHGFGGWIPLDEGPDLAAFRGDSTGLAPPDPRGDMVGVDLTAGAKGELVARMSLVRMRPVLDGGFEPDVDLSDTPEARAIFADVEAGLLGAK